MSHVLTNSSTSGPCCSNIFALPSVHHPVTVFPLEYFSGKSQPLAPNSGKQEPNFLKFYLPPWTYMQILSHPNPPPESPSNYQSPLGLSFLFNGLEIDLKFRVLKTIFSAFFCRSGLVSLLPHFVK